MPRIFKGTETLLKLFVPRVDEGNLETLKIALFTDDTNNAAEFYGDNMTIDGDTVYLKVNAWSFDMMNDGVLNYIAEIEIGEETIITERQSNYFLKTPNQYVPVGPDLSDYYTKEEIMENIYNPLRGDIDEIVDNKWGLKSGEDVIAGNYGTYTVGYLKTINGESLIGNSDIKLPSMGEYVNLENTVEDVQEAVEDVQEAVNNIVAEKWAIISGDKTVASNYGNTEYAYLKTINGESLIGEGDITIEGGGGDLSNYYTKTEIDTMIGDINNILETI